MNWLQPLNKPIALKDGREIATLAAARDALPSLADQDRRLAVWRDLGELVAEAAADKSWVREVEIQLSWELKAVGLID